jgi:hypothetical protein
MSDDEMVSRENQGYMESIPSCWVLELLAPLKPQEKEKKGRKERKNINLTHIL